MSVLGLIFFLAGVGGFIFSISHAPEKAFTGTVTWVLKSEVYYTFIILSACSSLYGLYEIIAELIKKEKKEEKVLLAIETKKCPACAEFIKFEARVCKHCGYSFSEDELMQHNLEREALLKLDEYALKRLPSSDFSLWSIGWTNIVGIVVVGSGWFLVGMDNWQRTCATRSYSRSAWGFGGYTMLVIVFGIIYGLWGMYDKAVIPALADWSG